jgi:hypothetical protein
MTNVRLLPQFNNSMIQFFAWKATRKFGGDDGLFNSACFAGVIREEIGLPAPDGLIVKLILSGRTGIKQIGDAHWRLLGRREPPTLEARAESLEQPVDLSILEGER